MSYKYLTINNTSVRNNDLQHKIATIYEIANKAIENGMANCIHSTKGEQSIGLCVGLVTTTKLAEAIDGWVRGYEMPDVYILDGNRELDDLVIRIINNLYNACVHMQKHQSDLQSLRSSLYLLNEQMIRLIDLLTAKVHVNANADQAQCEALLHYTALACRLYLLCSNSQYGFRTYHSIPRKMHVNSQKDINNAWGTLLNMCYVFAKLMSAINCVTDIDTLGEWLDSDEHEASIASDVTEAYGVVDVVADPSLTFDVYKLYNCCMEYIVDQIWKPDDKYSDFIKDYEDNM